MSTSAGRPTSATTLYRLDASDAGGPLDIFGTFTTGTSSNVATHYRRIRPGLTLRASRSRLPRGVGTNVTFRVLDAGDPVKGAKVRAGGRSATTNSQGRATLRLTANGSSLRATTTARGYTSGSLRLKVG